MDSKKRFIAIEGLRAWLAWAVVLDHLAYFANFGVLGPILRGIGSDSVLAFIIVSGFVITHLLIERPEPYRIYLLRRFMRLFPLFVVTCIGGYFAYELQIRLLAYGFDDQEFASLLTNIAASADMYFWQHVLAHLTMLHSAINNHLLPFSYFVFNMPAWSLSLEWQFYLVAPLVVIATVRRPFLVPLIAALVALASLWLFKKGWFGNFDTPGLLPAMAGYFAVGIASRLIYPMFAGKKIENVNAALASVVILYMFVGKPLVLWLIVYSGFTFHLLGNRIIAQGYRLALESRIATYFGARSYSIYLCHFPLIIACEGLWIALFSTPPGALILLAMTIPTTMAISEILYRTVELPGIKLGSRMARRLEMPLGLESRPQTAEG
jgi:peptidoglycan/LPS O-acetylase OafA/YrhL